MQPDAMKRLVRRAMEEGFNKADFDVIDECLHEDYVRHGHIGYPGANGLAEHKRQLAERRTMLADARFTIDDMVAEGDTVAVRFTLSGRHAGEYMGIAASGHAVERQTFVFFKFRGDKIAESHALTDIHGSLQQMLGVPVR